MSHTPGPWKAVRFHQDGGLRFWECDVESHASGVKHVAAVQGGHRTEEAFRLVRANARLIAAAPDLLEACEAFLRWMREGGVHSNTHAVSLAESAIAKARG